MSFQYPGNWWIDTWDEEYDPNANVYVEPMQDAWVQIMLYPCDSTAATELQATMTLLEEWMDDLSPSEASDLWGKHHGHGRSLRGTVEGTRCSVRIFVARLNDDVCLQVRELCALADEPDVSPGFELIRSSFSLKP
jgi:hypothetical protein